MSRWEPDARGRLQQAALELFDERGFEQTTVEDLAGRAGVTKRTFFRHFADKREVLFAGGEEFQQRWLDGLRAAPASAPPLEAVGAMLDAVGAFFVDRHPHSRRRQRVIVASAELRERELVKLARCAAMTAEVLRERGVPEPTATLTAETAVVVFRTAFEQWAAAEEATDLRDGFRDGLAALRALTVA